MGFFGGIGSYIFDALIGFVNAIISALGSLVQGVLDTIGISMPTLPDPPSQLVAVEGWVSWFFPVGTVLNIFTFYGVAWLVWWLASIVLRWAKAVE